MPDFGYAGKILKIDISIGTSTELETANYTEKFLGGRGSAIKLFWDMVPPQAKAFSADNCILFFTGPTTGYNRLASSRIQVCGRSPATEPEAFSYASMGGGWGVRLKYAGYDGLVVQGKADRPVFIYIHDDSVEIRNASHLWGKTTVETFHTLKEEIGQNVSILTIGPAGENLVIFASTLADENTTGGGGLGAVMGSKKIKAIVVAANN